jgi:hypothetical protein
VRVRGLWVGARVVGGCEDAGECEGCSWPGLLTVALVWLAWRVLNQMRLGTVILEQGVSQNRRFGQHRVSRRVLRRESRLCVE